MSDNLFSFPGESTGQDAGDFFGGAGGVAFTDLGSADEVENPFKIGRASCRERVCLYV